MPRNSRVVSRSVGTPRDRVREVLGKLTPREEQVVRMRFGIGDGKARTLKEVGQKFSLTGERIRQVEAKALRKLRGARSPNS